VILGKVNATSIMWLLEIVPNVGSQGSDDTGRVAAPMVLVVVPPGILKRNVSLDLLVFVYSAFVLRNVRIVLDPAKTAFEMDKVHRVQAYQSGKQPARNDPNGK
jgi:hypothetical protein